MTHSMSSWDSRRVRHVEKERVESISVFGCGVACRKEANFE